jgi:hypothetical protein
MKGNHTVRFNALYCTNTRVVLNINFQNTSHGCSYLVGSIGTITAVSSTEVTLRMDVLSGKSHIPHEIIVSRTSISPLRRSDLSVEERGSAVFETSM